MVFLVEKRQGVVSTKEKRVWVLLRGESLKLLQGGENVGRVGKRERGHYVAEYGNRFAAYERRCFQHSEYWWVPHFSPTRFLLFDNSFSFLFFVSFSHLFLTHLPLLFLSVHHHSILLLITRNSTFQTLLHTSFTTRLLLIFTIIIHVTNISSTLPCHDTCTYIDI